MKQAKRASLQDISALFEDLKKSGLTLRAFSLKQQIPYSRILYYKKRLARADFPALKAVKARADFIQILPTTEAKRYSQTLTLRCGAFEVDFREDSNVALFGRLLEVIKYHA